MTMRKDRTNQAQYLKPTVFIFGFMDNNKFQAFQSKCFEQETALITTDRGNRSKICYIHLWEILILGLSVKKRPEIPYN